MHEISNIITENIFFDILLVTQVANNFIFDHLVTKNLIWHPFKAPKMYCLDFLDKMCVNFLSVDFT